MKKDFTMKEKSAIKISQYERENYNKRRKRKILQTSLIALSMSLYLQANILEVNAKNKYKRSAEEKFRIEHHIDKDVELIDLRDKVLLKLESTEETKFYLCDMLVNTFSWEVTLNDIQELFQDTSSELFLKSVQLENIKNIGGLQKEFIDVDNNQNIFTIFEKSINVYTKTSSSQKNELICWGDIKTYSNTVTGNCYTEYFSFDVPTQQVSKKYVENYDEKITICYDLRNIWEEDYIIREDLDILMDNLNSGVYILKLK